MDVLRIESHILHPEVQPVSREEVQESLKSQRITLPYFTDYELVALIGIRAQQIADGARPLVSLEGMITSDADFVRQVAEVEIQQRKLPFIVHRRLPNGTSEYWSASELSILKV